MSRNHSATSDQRMTKHDSDSPFVFVSARENGSVCVKKRHSIKTDSVSLCLVPFSTSPPSSFSHSAFLPVVHAPFFLHFYCFSISRCRSSPVSSHASFSIHFFSPRSFLSHSSQSSIISLPRIQTVLIQAASPPRQGFPS